jgi:paraquat-inducible protein B
MSEERPNQPPVDKLPEATVEKPSGISIVWIIPLVAALVGGWLAYKTISEKGPTITITFEDAAGLEAGKTKVKFKSITVGQVEKVAVHDIKKVEVTAKMDNHAEKDMTEDTEFWVVRPRIGAGGVSGLETLVSGAYIGINPRKTGAPTSTFTGLEKPPGIGVDDEGAQFILKAENLGTILPGTSIFYRDIKVGRVVDYEFAEDKEGVIIEIFIEAPHHLLVHNTSRFWLKTGIDVAYSAEGLEVKVESLATLLAGGIAFDNPVTAGGSNTPSKSGTEFTLFPDIKSKGEAKYVKKNNFLVRFDGSVRGLNIGAPVEFRGIKIGSVIDIAAKWDPKTFTVDIPVVIELEPERFSTREEVESREPKRHELNNKLVELGLRAQLQTGSLLTGQLYVELDFYPDDPKKQLILGGKYPEIPTVPSSMDQLKHNVNAFVEELNKMPLDKIGQELLETMQGANRFANAPELLEAIHTLNVTLEEIRGMTVETRDSLNRSFDDLGTLTQHLDIKVVTLSESIEKTLGATRAALKVAKPGSPAAVNLNNALKELASAARSIRVLADYLERHPEALVQGKGKSGR